MARQHRRWGTLCDTTKPKPRPSNKPPSHVHTVASPSLALVLFSSRRCGYTRLNQTRLKPAGGRRKQNHQPSRCPPGLWLPSPCCRYTQQPTQTGRHASRGERREANAEKDVLKPPNEAGTRQTDPCPVPSTHPSRISMSNTHPPAPTCFLSACLRSVHPKKAQKIRAHMRRDRICPSFVSLCSSLPNSRVVLLSRTN